MTCRSDWGPIIFSNYTTFSNPFINGLYKLFTTLSHSNLFNIGHYIVVTIFLLFVGISTSFSRSNFKRALKVFICAIIITLGTIIITIVTKEDVLIIFGILHMISFSILLYAIVAKISENRLLILLIGIILIARGFLIKWYDTPYIYNLKDLNLSNIIQIILGYKLFGADCFGLLPCTGVVFIGAFLGQTVYRKKVTLIPRLEGAWIRPFCFIGRHAIIIYLLHQIVNLLILIVIFLIAGYRF